MASSRHRLGRAVLAAAVIAVAIAAWHYRDLLARDHLQAFIISNRAWIAADPWTPLVFILLHVVVSLTFLPRSLIAIAGGLLWGLWGGTLMASLAGLAGASAGFFVARYLNNGLIKPERLPGFGALLARLEQGGWRAVALLRLVPVMPHTPVNYAFGLTRIGYLPYCIGTALGSLPTTVLYVDLGAVGESAVTTRGQWYLPAAIGLVALAISFLLPRWVGVRGAKD